MSLSDLFSDLNIDGIDIVLIVNKSYDYKSAEQFMKMISILKMHFTNASNPQQLMRSKVFRPEMNFVRRPKKDHSDSILPSIDDEVKKNVRITCQENFNQYLVNTTLHGLRYVGDRKITSFERFFFGIMFILVFMLSVYFITNVWIKWSASPMIITMSAVSTPITEFPFPAVTICNMNQARKSAVAKIPLDSVEYGLVQSLCYQNPEENVTNTKSGKWIEFRKVLMDVSQPCDDMLVACRYGSLEYDCKELFKKVLTDEGLCCIFNGVDQAYLMKAEYSKTQDLNSTGEIFIKANDWTPEKGYSQGFDRKATPRPAAGTGNNLGLSLLLDVSKSEYYCSSTNSFGFKILLHSPNELPKISNYGTSIANGYETRVVIEPQVSEASFSIRSIPKRIRQCIFESENYLDLYKTYSRRNCQTEFETKLFFEICKCVLYYMPRSRDDITICGRSDTECVNRVAHELQTKTNSSFQFECLPGCFAINYNTEISLSPLLQRSPWLIENQLTVPNTAVVHVYYKENSVRSQRKEQLIGFTEFLSNTGGLLGLFMGFSVISISELFYFMSIRPYCNYLRISEKRRLFGGVFQKVQNLRMKKKSEIASQALVKKHVDNSVFPYID